MAIIHQVALIYHYYICNLWGFLAASVVAQWTALVPLLHCTHCPANTRHRIVIGPMPVVYGGHTSGQFTLACCSE